MRSLLTGVPTCMLTNGVQSIFRQLPHIRSAAMKPFNSNVVAIVIGTTGSGKTKLGVELASKFGGEVINADSIQMYKGLDVASAKVTDEEMCGVRHHLLSFLPPTREYTVREFERDATALIEDIHSRNKVPVIVGGTMYYVQSLLRPSTLQSVEVRRSGPEVDAALAELAALPDEALHDRLLEVDPMMAERLHVNDQRKLRRALESYYQTGLPHSELLRIQAEGVRAETSKFRFAIFWLQTNQQVRSRCTALLEPSGSLVKNGRARSTLHACSHPHVACVVFVCDRYWTSDLMTELIKW